MDKNNQKWWKIIKGWLRVVLTVSAFLFFVLIMIEVAKKNAKKANYRIAKCVEIVQNSNLSGKEQLLFIMFCKQREDVAYEILRELQERQNSD